MLGINSIHQVLKNNSFCQVYHFLNALKIFSQFPPMHPLLGNVQQRIYLQIHLLTQHDQDLKINFIEFIYKNITIRDIAMRKTNLSSTRVSFNSFHRLR